MLKQLGIADDTILKIEEASANGRMPSTSDVMNSLKDTPISSRALVEMLEKIESEGLIARIPAGCKALSARWALTGSGRALTNSLRHSTHTLPTHAIVSTPAVVETKHEETKIREETPPPVGIDWPDPTSAIVQPRNRPDIATHAAQRPPVASVAAPAIEQDSSFEGIRTELVRESILMAILAAGMNAEINTSHIRDLSMRYFEGERYSDNTLYDQLKRMEKKGVLRGRMTSFGTGNTKAKRWMLTPHGRDIATGIKAKLLAPPEIKPPPEMRPLGRPAKTVPTPQSEANVTLALVLEKMPNFSGIWTSDVQVKWLECLQTVVSRVPLTGDEAEQVQNLMNGALARNVGDSPEAIRLT